MHRLCWALVLLSLAAPALAADPDLKAWQEFFEHCALPANGGFLEDGGFCDDFRREKPKEFASIQAQDNKYVDTIPNQSKLEILSEDIEEMLPARPGPLVSLETHGLARMMKKHHHKYSHKHHRPGMGFTQDPIHTSIWPNANIYYAIATVSDATNGITPLKTEMYERVLEAAKQWEAATCLDFISTAEDDATNGLLVFGDSTTDRCASPIAFPGATHKSAVQLQGPGGARWTEGCPMWTVVHEMGHAAGLHHTHTRQDRNTYVTVQPGAPANNYDQADTTHFTDEPLVGTNEEKADEFYDSVELYYLDGNTDMDIAVGWAAAPAALTPVEEGLRDAWKVASGQRNHLGKLDIRTVNNKYGCFPAKVRDLGSVDPATETSFVHPEQTIGQLVDKLAVFVKKDPTALSLYTAEDKSQEHTQQPRTTKLSALTTPITSASTITLEVSANKVTFEFGGWTVPLAGWRIFLSEKHVFFKTTDTLAHVLDVVKYHGGQDFTGKDVSKASTVLDKTKTMAQLGVANNDKLRVAE